MALTDMLSPTAIMAMGGVMIGVFVLFAIAGYIYTALVWMTIAKKLGYDKPWLAWIPIANFFLLPILVGKKWTWGFMILVPIANIVFAVIWVWKIYELRNYPGWLALIPLGGFIPVVGGFVGIANLVIIGMVAWKDRTAAPVAPAV